MAVYLHYIGKRWYTKESFIKEGKEMDVQRLTSFSMARRLFKEKATIYYAVYNNKRNYAEVFAKGKVIGIASTMPYLRKLVKDDIGYVFESRRCGTCFSSIIIKDDEEIIKILEQIDEREARRYRWFIVTDIIEYNSAIDNKIEYKVRQRQIIVSDIGFTRGFIKLCGGISEIRHDKSILKIIKMHKLRNSSNFDDTNANVKVDTSRYTQLDNWLGGGGIQC
ncbi:MAG: hypothetical protein QW101_08310 [Ignisphaera sp.]